MITLKQQECGPTRINSSVASMRSISAADAMAKHRCFAARSLNNHQYLEMPILIQPPISAAASVMVFFWSKFQALVR